MFFSLDDAISREDERRALGEMTTHFEEVEILGTLFDVRAEWLVIDTGHGPRDSDNITPKLAGVIVGGGGVNAPAIRYHIARDGHLMARGGRIVDGRFTTFSTVGTPAGPMEALLWTAVERLAPDWDAIVREFDLDLVEEVA